MWRIYLIEFICVAIISVTWVYFIDKSQDDRNKINRGDSEHNREEDSNDDN